MPDDPVVRFGLAGAYLDAGLADDAVAEYRQAVPLQPDYTAAYPGPGRPFQKAGRPQGGPAGYPPGVRGAGGPRGPPAEDGGEVVPREVGPPGEGLGAPP